MMNALIKHCADYFWKCISAVLFVGGMLAASQASAALNSTAATLTAASPAQGPASVVYVNGNASITVGLTVTSTSNTQWRSTSWQINGGTVTCATHAAGTTNGTSTQTFTITAPAAAGTYNISFVAYSNGSCGGQNSNTLTLTGGIIVSCTGTGTGLLGDYFNTAGGTAPAIPATPALQRTDATVDFNWGGGSPGAGIGADNFATRWSGQVEAPWPGNYTFCVSADDGVRLWVDGVLLVDRWIDQGPTYYASVPVALSSCSRHDVVMEYYENGGGTEARLKWFTPGTSGTCNASATTIPQAQLYPIVPPRLMSAGQTGCTAVLVTFNKAMDSATTGQGAGNPANYLLQDPTSATVVISSVTVAADRRSATLNLATSLSNGSHTLTVANIADTGSPVQVMTSQSTGFAVALNTFLGEYYANRTLTPPYAATRADANINFDWTTGAPGVTGVGADNFSIRWTGTATAPATGWYTFYTQSDDGVRLYVNTGSGYSLVIDNWTDHSPTENGSAPISLSAGQVIGISMEYYENGGGAVAQLRWSAGNTSATYPANLTNVLAKQLIAPSSQCLSPGGSSASASNFECIETGLAFSPSPARHPLYTKLVGTNFRFDIVALRSDGTIETGYVGSGAAAKTVTVELFDDSTSPQPACSAYAGAIAAQTFTLADTDLGRKTVPANFAIGNAYPKMRCRVRDAIPVYGCSSDGFTVRPTSITAVTSSNANADNAGASTVATPAIKAGTSFALTAATGLSGYNGTPKVDATKTEWLSVPVGGRAAPGVGAVAGVFPTATSGTATGSAFTYDDVGYFRFQAQGVYDDAFTAASSDITNTDCTNDFSNTLVGGRYGCYFGNTVATNYFGRFMPDHFSVVTPVTFTPGCGTFTYMGQPFTLLATIEARNLANVKTTNYSGGYAHGALISQIENANSGSAITNSRLTTSGTWSGGSYPFAATQFSRPASGVDGPYASLAIGVAVIDEGALAVAARPFLINRDMDETNVSCTADSAGTSNGTCTAATLTTMAERYGRFRLANAFGSERLPLSVPAQAEYFNGAGWALNTLDNCTVVPLPVLSPSPVGLSTTPAYANSPLSGGLAGLSLTAPSGGATGYVDLTVNVPSYLEFAWRSATVADPVARATFGIYKGNDRLIYRRERY